ncbi:MAG: single-stranded-DNA-specific exonuclease RecJ [Flavobacteriaceae bacterium]|nr:single-stranded-DNA-specific exonuclease RecJ [Flavobacteriaceae bacterium]
MLWQSTSPPETTNVQQLSMQLNVPQEIAYLLVQRGITSFDQAKFFFRPVWEDLHSPFLMQDMKKAVERIAHAIEIEESVMIFGDYDVDGTTAVALMTSYLKSHLDHVVPYIPDRYKEGYGISIAGIDYAKSVGISLIIALDCGIKAHEQIEYADRKGIDFIICDHHLPDDELPKAAAVLDPKRADCKYPFKELCGCGIGFKLIQALNQYFELADSNLTPYLDLVATAIAADIVPMTGENRLLSYLGIEQMRKAPRPGLQFFISGLNKPVSVSDLVFVIAPRINAAGRMNQGISAVELLLSRDQEEALPLARSIEFSNTERRSTDERITKEALQQIELDEAQHKLSTVVYHPSWHKGVIGIVASRLIEKYYRPTVVITKSETLLAGSARSVNGFDVYQALEACKDQMIQFGGHKYAAGLTMKEEQLGAFKEAFEYAVESQILDSQLKPVLRYDAELKFDAITSKLYRILAQMAPFGPKNMKPVFVTHNCIDKGGSRLVGNDKNHLKLQIIDSTGSVMQAIGFGLGGHYSKIKKKYSFSILYTLDENEFNYIKSLQLVVKDIQFKV